jgi:toxin ParE1/3/4
MPRPVYRPEAQSDLKAAYRYVAEFHPIAAERLLQNLDEKARLLAASPLLGIASDELSPGLRRFPIEHYVIYKITDDGIDIVRILHGARDIEAMFNA